MEDQHFEQVINLKDKPSVRKNRTPEMDQMYKQRTFNHLFSIDEDSPEGRRSCSGKTLILISAATIFILASLFVFLLIVFGPSSENEVSSEESSGNSSYKVKFLNSTGKPTKRTPPKAPDPALVTKKQPQATSKGSMPSTSTAPPHSSEADPTTSSEISVTSTVAVDDVTSPANHLLEFTSHGSTHVCPVEQSTDTSGCLISPLELCRSPSACQTFLPNRYDKGATLSGLKRQYRFFNMMLANFTCHPQARDFMCSILSPSCPESTAERTQRISETNYAFDVMIFPTSATKVPCSSLCTEIGAVCLSDTSGGWTELCQSMPESPSSEICFGGNKTAVSQCELSPCYNGGTCFTQGSESYCKCPRGYFGKVCNKTSLSGTNITRGECVSVPEQCLSVLPYNTTRGLNLNDTSLAYIAPWESIATVVQKDMTKRLFCALFYPQCKDNANQVYTVCRDLCRRTKNKVEFVLAALGFPSLQCDRVPYDAGVERNGLTCI